MHLCQRGATATIKKGVYVLKQSCLWVCLSWSLCAGAWANQGLPPLKPLERLELQRYLGRWFEVAKFPNRFQSQCVSEAQAEYQLLDNGRIEVINQCKTASGQVNTARGVARAVGEEGTAMFEVRFLPSWLEFLPFAWGKYWVIDLDKDYTLAVVSEPNREYLWVLSRAPVVDEKRWNALLTRLEAQGFSIGRLERTPQAVPTQTP